MHAELLMMPTTLNAPALSSLERSPVFPSRRSSSSMNLLSSEAIGEHFSSREAVRGTADSLRVCHRRRKKASYALSRSRVLCLQTFLNLLAEIRDKKYVVQQRKCKRKRARATNYASIRKNLYKLQKTTSTFCISLHRAMSVQFLKRKLQVDLLIKRSWTSTRQTVRTMRALRRSVSAAVIFTA